MNEATCLVPACDRKVVAKGMCSLHWQRARRGAPLEAPPKNRNLGKACTIEGCEAPSRKRGWCSKHYERWSKHGDPAIVKTPTKNTKACSVKGCERQVYAVEMCIQHRRRFLKGTPLERPFKQFRSQECKIDGCSRKGNRRGICQLHYERAVYRANPAPIKARVAQRRHNAARGMDEVDRQMSADYREAIAKDPCGYCGGRSEVMHVDHYFPIAKGGTDHWWNLVMACWPCNARKHARCGTRFALMRAGGVHAVDAPAVA